MLTKVMTTFMETLRASCIENGLQPRTLAGHSVCRYFPKSVGAALLACALMAKATFAQPVDTVVAANYAPLMIAGNTERPGYAIEVLRAAAAQAGRQIDISFMPFQRAMHQVQTGPAVLMPALYHGKSSNDKILWLAKIQVAYLRFSTLTGRIDTLAAARALESIVVEESTTADVFLTSRGFENLVRVNTPESSARMLAAGRVGAWFQNERVVKQEWQRLQITTPLGMGDVVHEVPIFLVASPTLSEDVVAAYQQAIAALRADGTLSEIWESYSLE